MLYAPPSIPSTSIRLQLHLPTLSSSTFLFSHANFWSACDQRASCINFWYFFPFYTPRTRILTHLLQHRDWRQGIGWKAPPLMLEAVPKGAAREINSNFGIKIVLPHGNPLSLQRNVCSPWSLFVEMEPIAYYDGPYLFQSDVCAHCALHTAHCELRTHLVFEESSRLEVAFDCEQEWECAKWKVRESWCCVISAEGRSVRVSVQLPGSMYAMQMRNPGPT